MFLSLEGEALQSAIEFHDSLCDYEIKSKVGVEIIISWLNNLYKNDDALSKFLVSQAFETCKKQSKLSMQEYINELEKRFITTKAYGTDMSKCFSVQTPEKCKSQTK